MVTHLECTKCSRRFEPGQVYTVCDECRAPLFARYDLPRAALAMRPGHLELREPTMWRYREVLPVPDASVRVTLGEGFTPLVPAPRLGERIGIPNLLIKEEGGNPTGSFKARGLAMAVSMAKALGATNLCLPSAGNAGSALAAYAARAGLRAHVFLPRDTSRVFVMETEAYGAEVVLVDGLITDAGRVCAERARENGWYECATLKEPYRIEGKKTLGYEIAEQLDWTLPDAVVYPTGGGTGLIGMWKAFAELLEMGFVRTRRPRMFAVQAEGCAPIVQAFHEGRDDAPPWTNAQTLALRAARAERARRLPDPARASREPRRGDRGQRPDLIQGVKDGAAHEGIFMAPEGGACVAAAAQLKVSGHISPDDTVVVFDTGTGYKYIDNMEPLWRA